MKRFLHACLCLCFVVSMPVILSAQVTANFSANNTSGCSPIVVQFTDLTTGGPTTWNWNLGNGTTSTLQNPSTTYITPGTYTVTLTAANAGGSNTKVMTSYITVAASPTVSFVSNDSSVSCPPKTVQFTNLTTAGTTGAVTYNWDFGDGTTSTAANPTHTYTTQGNFNVTLVATNSSGCVKALTKNNYVQLSAKPVTAFTANTTGSCMAPLTVNFTSNTAGGSTYSWTFGDGGTSTASSPSHTYTASGSYTVRLISTSAAGCKDTLIKPAYIGVGNLAAAFTQSTTSACVGAAVSFSNTSTPGPGTGTWYFGDGSVGSGINTSHAYAASGTYTVKLIVQNGTCADSTTHTVTVNPKPTAQFTATSTQSCAAPLTTSFSNTSVGASSYLWIFGDGSTSTATSPSHIYASGGSYTVKLVATNSNGCTDTMTVPGQVVIAPAAASVTASTNGGCAPLTTTFTPTVTSNGTVTAYSWNFGDGTTGTGVSPSHTYNTPGTYTVTMTYTLSIPGCTGAATTTVAVGSTPTPSFTLSPTTACTGQNITFTNNSTGATTYVWYFGDGTTSTVANPVRSYGGPGTYNVTLVAVNNSCPAQVTVPAAVTINGIVANFTSTFSCTNRLQYSFTNTSTGSNNTYLWNFGDGSTSTAVNPTHTYAAYGSYTVTLTATDAVTGCTSTKTISLSPFQLQATLVANDTTVCKGDVVGFNSAAGSGYTNYYYNFGDGIYLSNGASYNVHAYATPGVYSLSLTVTDISGCQATITKPNYIKVGGSAPNFTGTPLSGCTPLNVAFTDQSTAGPYAITSRNWIFGNGATSTAPNPAATYTANGSYTVKLAVADANGCLDTMVKPAYINVSKPVAQFASNDTLHCAGQTVQFSNTSTGSGLTYDWSFGDGTSSTQQSPSHVYATGNYTVRLIVTNNGGCKDTLIRTNYIHATTLTAGFNLSDTFANCPPLMVQFTNTTVGANSYTWVFENGAGSSIANPSTVFTMPGTYHVKLIAHNAAGCVDSIVKNVVVLGPTGSFTFAPTSGCVPLTLSFTATTQNTTSMTWDMNNGYTQTTTGNTYSYTYTQQGIYTPYLILSNGMGCNVAIGGTDTVKVGKMNAGFSYSANTICQNASVQFTDTSSSPVSPITGHTWNFGDGTTGTGATPFHQYTTAGTFTITLTATNAMGCSDTETHVIVVNPVPVQTVSGTQSLCPGGTSQLLASGGLTYSWSPAATLSCNTCANPTAAPTATTTYTAVATNSFGCHDTDQIAVTVHPQPNVSAGNNQTICSGTGTTLSATGASTYTWSPATNLSCTACASPAAAPTATTTYSVIGVDGFGCMDTAQTTVTVTTTPVLTTNGAIQNVCNGASAQLSVSGASNYVWTPSTGLSCTTCANPTANPTATTTYTVTGTIGTCTATTQVTVYVTSQPVITATAAPALICPGGSTTLQAGGATTYSWTPSTGLSCTNCANPTAAPTTTTTYTVTGTSPGGCVGTAQVTVTLTTPPVVSATGSQNICAGSSTALQATGANSYSWTPSTGLSCTTCANPTATPATTTTYIVTGSNGGGCQDTGMITVNVHAIPNVTASSVAAICQNDSATLQATGASTYVWTPSTGLSCATCATPHASPASTTIYTVTGTDGFGCSDTGVVMLTVHPLPSVTVSGPSAICAGSPASLIASGATSYSWGTAASLSCTNCANPTATPAITTSYVVTGTDASGCVDTGMIAVTVNAIPQVNAGADQTACAGTPVNLTATGAATYSWSPASGLSCANCASPVATPPATATYTVTGTNAAGCTNTDQVVVTIRQLPVVNAGPDQGVCRGTSVTLNGSGAATYTWSPAATLSCNTCTSPVATPTTTTTYTLTGTDAFGCSKADQVVLTIYQPPVVDAGADKNICERTPTQLNASGAATYTWSPAATLSCANCASPMASPSVATMYSVIGVDAHGCRDTDQVAITIVPHVATSVSPGDTICKGETVKLWATGGVSYRWTPADGLTNPNASSTDALPLQTTTYSVYIKENECYTDTSRVNIVVTPTPTVNAGPDQVIFAGSSANLFAQATGAVKYEWTPSEDLNCATCLTPVALPKKTTTYSIKATTLAGCSATDEVTISVRCDNSQLFMPNTFTPNGDGQNDRFYPRGKGIGHILRFRVYDRWGEVLYDGANIQPNDPNYGWDGTFKGNPLKPDVYVWIIDATCESGEPLQLKGDISIVR